MTLLLLTGDETAGPLAIARRAARLGEHVLVASMTGQRCPAGASRSVAADEVFTDVAAALDWAVRAADGIVAVIPCTDEVLDLTARARLHSDFDVRWLCPAPSTAAALVDKAASLSIAEDVGLDVPPWAVDEWPAVPDDSEVIIRPRSRATSGDTPFKLRVVRGRTEGEHALAELERQGASVVVQRMLRSERPMTAFGIVVASDEAPIACTTGIKLVESTADGGVMVVGRRVELDAVRQAAQQFVDGAGFVGLGGIEMMRAEGRWWFVEWNPRVEAIHFAGEPSLDTELAGLLGRDPVGGAAGPHRLVVGLALLERLRRRDVDTREGRIIIDAFFAPHSRPIWRWSDPGPGIALAGKMLRAYFTGRRH